MTRSRARRRRPAGRSRTAPVVRPRALGEQSGFSPSTISAEIAGLLAAAQIADRNHDTAEAAVWRGVADEFQRNLKTWTLTTDGPLGTGRYFIRLSKTGDPNAAISEVDRGMAGAAISRLEAMRNMSSGVGLIAEQAWEAPDLAASPFGTDPESASIGFENGKPAGSASALTVTAPTDRTIVNSPVTGAGTSAPGNTIRIAATNVDENSNTSITSATVGSGGSFSIPVTLIGGRSVLNIVATSPSGPTRSTTRSTPP